MSDKPIEWTDDLLVGDATIDSQHKAFFVKAIDLYVACRGGKGPQEITEALRFMRDYAASHFAAEEARMANVGYPYFGKHKETHRTFLERLDELEQEVTLARDKRAVAQHVAAFATEWFVQHISRADQPLVDFLNAPRDALDSK